MLCGMFLVVFLAIWQTEKNRADHLRAHQQRQVGGRGGDLQKQLAKTRALIAQRKTRLEKERADTKKLQDQKAAAEQQTKTTRNQVQPPNKTVTNVQVQQTPEDRRPEILQIEQEIEIIEQDCAAIEHALPSVSKTGGQL